MTDRKKPSRPTEPSVEEEVIFLKDLAPREDVKGGARKMRFGEPQPPKISLRKRRS